MFDLPDELFVSEAFLRVLGRPADPAGFSGYLRALRRGLPRARLIADLQASDEAQQRHPDAAVSRATETIPALWPHTRGQRVHGIDGMSHQDLLSVRGELFIDCSFAALLRRAPSAEERTHWLDRLAEGADRSVLLTELRRKPEFRRRGSLFGRWTPRRWLGRPWAPIQSAPARPPTAVDKAATVGRRSTVPVLSGTAIFTIASRSYLPYVRTLMTSVREHHPECHRLLLLADEMSDPEPRDEELFHTIGASEIGIECFDDMTLRYDVVEFSTALKPHFFKWLFRHPGLRSAIYLDPDIRLYQKLDVVRKLLGSGHSLVLTPHITAPLSDDHEPSDHTILKSGVFNLGFVAASSGNDAQRFIAWWADKLRTGSLVDLSQNLFTDQRWCDLAPAFVPSLAVLRHSGYNAAYWNIGQRNLRQGTDGCWLADTEPLVFFHFSGINPDRPTEVSKYQDRFRWEDLAPVQSLFAEYAEDLRTNGWDAARCRSYAYDRIGTLHLPALLRRLYRHHHPKPCMTTREESMHELVSLCIPERAGSSAPGFALSALMHFVYDSRADLQREFDLRRRSGRHAFASWFWSTAVPEYGLGELLMSVQRLQTARAAGINE